LGYAEAGDPDGRPVLYFHGIPGSRREQHPRSAIAEALGLRLIVLERPGYGLSDFLPGRRLLDWVADVEDLADRLDLRRFSVMGFSGGGPYALACAHDLPQRVTSTSLISSSAPYAAMDSIPANLALFEVARDNPQRAAAMMEELGGEGDSLYRLVTSLLGEAEKRVMSAPELAAMYRESMAEAVRQGVEGLVRDMAIGAADWGFPIEAVSSPVHLWHGLADGLTPPAMGRYLHETLPDCRATFLPGQGHYLLFPQWREILTTLVSAHRKRE
jgi:pimeloyl-ACP methyl ester carboxylesterase